MPLIQRQTPEQLELRSRQNTRRAAVGLAACVTTLLGVPAAVTLMAVDKAKHSQERVEDYLFRGNAPRSEDTTVYRQVSLLEHTTEKGSDAIWHVRSEPEPQLDTSLSWKTLGTIAGGAGTVSVGGLMLLGIAGRRRRDEQAARETDMETTDAYELYDFEQQLAADESRIQTGYDELAADHDKHGDHLTSLEQRATTALIAARANSEVNTGHMNVLSDLGHNPLEGLNYNDPTTYNTLLEKGQPVSIACQPILPPTRL
jgi:hypothetical protein